MKLNRVDLSPGVVYRGEGNANLVVAVPGTATVLRLPKSKYQEKSQAEKLEAMARYVNQVLRPVLRDFVSPVSIVDLDWAQLETIRAAVAAARPSKRLAKNVFSPCALLMEDHCFLTQAGPGPVLAVEIKPKQGFIHPQLQGEKYCNFCLKQIFKSRNGEDGAVKSKYCPLDLFSGDQARMETAIQNLMNTPKNNLRIFKDGIILHDENSAANRDCDYFISSILGHKSFLPKVLSKLLRSEPHCDRIEMKISANESLMKDSECSVKLSSPLPENSILNQVLTLQKCSLTDEEAEKVLIQFKLTGVDIDSLQHIISEGDTPFPDLTEDLMTKVQDLKRYCMAVTARDLSIIVAISPDNTASSGNTLIINQKQFRYKLSIIDLDPKNLQRISKYIENRKLWSDGLLNTSF